MKKSFKRVLQMIILVFTMLMGFWFTYALAWTWIELPMKWWSNVILLVLATLSCLGWIRWIDKG